MAHNFSVETTLTGISLQQFQQLLAQPQLHEAVCQAIPCQDLKILSSELNADLYTLRRSYQLDIQLPEVAKKFLKDALLLQRVDVTNVVTANSSVELRGNFPFIATGVRHISGNDQAVTIRADWQIQVKIPLIGGLIEKHAEGEVRRFTTIEVSVVEAEIKKYLQPA